MAGMTEAIFGVPPWEKKSVASLKTCDKMYDKSKKDLNIKGHTPRMFYSCLMMLLQVTERSELSWNRIDWTLSS